MDFPEFLSLLPPFTINTSVHQKKQSSQAGWWFQHVSTPPKNISQWEGLSHIL